MKLTRKIIYLLIFIIMMGLAWYAGFKQNFGQLKVSESQTAIMEKVEKVFKLITVEGQISEIYSYKDYYYYDISLLRKKALIRVNAKVSVGYNMEGLQMDIDEESRVISLNQWPEPEIISIDHDLEYYDMDEGTFNNFSDEELTQLNNSAKRYALEKAKESDLFDKAEEQKSEIISMIRLLAQAQGYRLEIQEGLLDLPN